jgi:uncharacterized protein with von Willebrand factor type A (vWA) domain
MDYPKKMTARFTPYRYMRVTGLTEHQVYMKIYNTKYKKDPENRERMLKSSRESTQRLREKKRAMIQECASDNQMK